MLDAGVAQLMLAAESISTMDVPKSLDRLRRIRFAGTALRLERRLSVDGPGVPALLLRIDLLDEVALRRRLILAEQRLLLPRRITERLAQRLCTL